MRIHFFTAPFELVQGGRGRRWGSIAAEIRAVNFIGDDMGDRISTNVEADLASQPITKTAIALWAIAVVRKRSL